MAHQPHRGRRTAAAARSGAGRSSAAGRASPPSAAGAPDDTAPDIRDLDLLARWLDTRFRIPGTRIRFGYDALIGLVPGIGGVAMTIPAVYLVWRAHGLGVPRSLIAHMLWNVAVDLAVGAVPVIGDIFDVAFKANRRNVDLLRRHLDRPAR